MTSGEALHRSRWRASAVRGHGRAGDRRGTDGGGIFVIVNGAFGVGKTTTAELLVEAIPGALLLDPEIVGDSLQRTLGSLSPIHDFQDLPVWRSTVITLGCGLVEDFDLPIVIPMTLWNPAYLKELQDGLKTAAEVVTVRLTATRDELTTRILRRPDAEGSHAWCLEHLDSGLDAFSKEEFGLEVSTSGKTPSEVARSVLDLLPEWVAHTWPTPSNDSSTSSRA